MNQQMISPVGVIKKHSNYDCIHIRDAFKKALKRLDQFSHMIIFIMEDQAIRHRVFKVVDVHEHLGIVITESSSLSEGTYVYDIKAYMPCEDRVPSDLYKEETVTFYDKVDFERKPIMPMAVDGLLESEVRFIGAYCYNNGQQIRLEDGTNLDGIMPQDYLRVIWWFDKFDKPEYRKTLQVNPPYEQAPKSGVFATRSPVRPNLIASTVVQVLSVHPKDRILEITGFDGFDGTKVIDLLPYIPELENVRAYYVPPYLEHWPTHKGFGFSQGFSQNQKLHAADSDIMMRLIEEEGLQINHPKQILTPEKVEGFIQIINANENNLKHVSTMIPRNKMTVVTGVSGSGKSSLVFDTLYKECQHQYVGVMGDGDTVISKPDVEAITGLMPAVTISQKSISKNSRSTVGTLTGITHHLRLLYAMIGTRHCPDCMRPIKALPMDAILQLIAHVADNHHVSVRGFKEEAFMPYNQNPKLIKDCLEVGNGAIEVQLDNHQVFMLQTKAYCYHCDRIFFDMTATMFSPNNVEYMCPECRGSGIVMSPTEARIVHNPKVSILDGASRLWGNLRKYREQPSANWMKGQVLGLAEEMGINLEIAYEDLPEDFKQLLMHGTGERQVSFHYKKGGREGVITRPVEGAINIVKRLLENTTSSDVGLAKHFFERKPCGVCDGEQLLLESRLVTVDGLRYPVALEMSISKLREWILKLERTLPTHILESVRGILDHIKKRLLRLEDLGLAYLTVNRTATTLSGGEGQRVRLAAQFGNELSNMLYILDEPTMGLHSCDYKALMNKLKGLCALDNTVVVVEHKKDVMLMADHIIDVGKGAGQYGGEIVAEGSVEAIIANKASRTGRHLLNEGYDLEPITFQPDASQSIQLKGACANNLKHLDVMFPKRKFTCVTGVSGSGKSTLVSDTLSGALLDYLDKPCDVIGKFEAIFGHEDITDVINITQSPIGKTPRSTPATYTGVFDHIRDFYAKLQQAKEMGLKKEHFSFNGKLGACDTCGGMGRIQHKMGFMDDIWTECQVCKGKRFKSEVLAVTYQGYTISDVLDMEVLDALELFKNHPKISSYLQLLADVGLSYIKLGQSASTLSGGEAQRIKLAAGLSGQHGGHCLYILDEPTTGLHFEDISCLLDIIRKLSMDHTVIAIEHNPALISACDYVIDMGPGGGIDGGYIITSGSPFEVANHPDSLTGSVLLTQS